MIPYSKPVRYECISKALNSENNKMTVKELCEYADVSRSGYYYWLNSAPKRKEREEKDLADIEKIKEAYLYKGYKKGAGEIHMTLLHMTLLHMDQPVVMNVKKIRRLMKKSGLECPIRKANPYRKMKKATYESKVAPNLLDRRFTEFGPRVVFLTDITYIPLKDSCENKRFAYLSVIMDAYTKEVLAYKVSANIKEDFVLETFEMLLSNHKITSSKICLIHSDQGVHYTSVKFQQLINNAGLRQSMSRRGNCWDNAPQESFFGHMKDDLNEKMGFCRNIAMVREMIDEWMEYYNNDRYQWNLAKLSPKEYYGFVTTGIYPLDISEKPPVPEWNKNPDFEKDTNCAEQTAS